MTKEVVNCGQVTDSTHKEEVVRGEGGCTRENNGHNMRRHFRGYNSVQCVYGVNNSQLKLFAVNVSNNRS